MARELSEFETIAGLCFRDRDLLRTVFVHSSFVNEAAQQAVEDNERLEFLGDAVLSMVVADQLYARYPNAREGELTTMRAALVRRETLADYARRLQLGDFLVLGHGEDESGGRHRAATLCATFEAVVGALFLDQGLDAVKSFVTPLLEHDLRRVERVAVRKDAKSRLQEWSQSNLGVSPRYRVLAEEGPDHDKLFTSSVVLGEARLGVGRGRSKQESSQAAAAMALARLGLDAPEYQVDAALEMHYRLDDPGTIGAGN